MNEASPDLVVMTGDFVSSKPLPRHFGIRMSQHCAEILSRIECPLRYAILGNHDVLVSAHAVTDSLVTQHPALETVSFVPIERDGRRLWLAGLEDALQQRPDLLTALPAGRNPDKEPLYPLPGARARFRRSRGRAPVHPAPPDTLTEVRFASPFLPPPLLPSRTTTRGWALPVAGRNPTRR